MNIFVLDKDVGKIAEYHCDKHVVKMILESAQMLCTVSNNYGLDTPYRSVHKKHPCTQWAGYSQGNWLWLRDLCGALNSEYLWRYDKGMNHKAWDVVQRLEIPPIPDKPMTPFVMAMPDKYKQDDVIKAYRTYYVHEKSKFAVWSEPSKKPAWFRKSKYPVSID